MSYDQGIHATYRFPTAAVDTDAVIGRIVGPAGKKGRLLDVASVVINEVTDASAKISVGNADNDARYGYHTQPIGAAAVTTNGITRGTSEYIAADSDVVVSSDGGATAGDSDIVVHIVWF